MFVLLGESDVSALLAHLRRHLAESGRAGDAIFSPRSADLPFDAEATADRHVSAWARALDEPQWTPRPTVGVRLVSVIGDNLQHAGQASYLRGLIENRRWFPA